MTVAVQASLSRAALRIIISIMNQGCLYLLKKELRSKLPATAYEIWIDPLVQLEGGGSGPGRGNGGDGRKLVLGCPNDFSLNWIKQNYGQAIEEVLARLENVDLEYELAVAPPAPLKETAPRPQSQLDLPYQPGRILNRSEGLNPAFTFEHFITGPSNLFAHQAAMALAGGQGMPLGALYLQADTGLGKSHLSQAVGWSLLNGARQPRVLYLTAEEFTNQMISSIKTGQTETFRSRFRKSCDALILDEVQFLSGKEKTQAELGYTLDNLMSDGKKILFSGSRLPKEIPGLKKELASRLSMGVVATIDQPDLETRIRIVEAKAREKGVELQDEVVEALARSVQRDVRRLESGLMNLLARSRLMNRPVNADLVREVVDGQGGRPATDLDQIINLVCRSFKVTKEELASASRLKKITLPRSIVFYLGRRYTDLTLASLGKELGRRHTAVLYALDRIERSVVRKDSLGRQVLLLAQKIEGN